MRLPSRNSPSSMLSVVMADVNLTPTRTSDHHRAVTVTPFDSGSERKHRRHKRRACSSQVTKSSDRSVPVCETTDAFGIISYKETTYAHFRKLNRGAKFVKDPDWSMRLQMLLAKSARVKLLKYYVSYLYSIVSTV